MAESTPDDLIGEPKRSRLASFANGSAWTAAWLFFSGGLTLKGVFWGKPAFLELGYWGVGLVPLMYLVATGQREWRDLSFVRKLHRLWPYLGHAKVAYKLAAVVCLLHFFALLARHYSFNTEWDMAIYANACANGLHSSLRGHTSLMADHFEPILYLFSPFCSVVNPAVVLFASQCLAWFLGSIGVRRLALQTGWSRSLASAAMIFYLLFSGFQTAAYNDFHPYTLCLGTIPWLLYYAKTKQLGRLSLVVAVHLMLKESTGLFLAGLGVFLMVSDQRKIGGGLVITGLISFVLVMLYVFPYFRAGEESAYFGKYYGYLGSNFREFLVTVVTKPWVPLAEALKPEKIWYVLRLLAPFAFIHLLSARTLIPIFAPVAISVLSSMEVMYSLKFHYEAEVFSWLFVAAVSLSYDENFAERWKKLWRKHLRISALTPVMVWLGFGFAFSSGVTPLGRIAYYLPSRPQIDLALSLDSARRQLASCHVAAVERVAPHLATIRELTMLPEHFAADAIVVAYPQGERLWMQSFDMIESQYVPLWNSSFKLTRPLRYDSDYRVWTKGSCKWDLTPLVVTR